MDLPTRSFTLDVTGLVMSPSVDVVYGSEEPHVAKTNHPMLHVYSSLSWREPRRVG